MCLHIVEENKVSASDHMTSHRKYFVLEQNPTRQQFSNPVTLQEDQLLENEQKLKRKGSNRYKIYLPRNNSTSIEQPSLSKYMEE